MNTKITKNPASKTITVERIFNAPHERVWNAWTDSVMLEKWWAPKPWKAVTDSFDFSEGGHWHYYMSGPEGEKMWSWVDYDTIRPKNSFSARDTFCDEKGNKNKDMSSMHWLNEFHDEGNTTKVRVTITFVNEADMNKIIEMGFEEGFTMALNNLDEVLAS